MIKITRLIRISHGKFTRWFRTKFDALKWFAERQERQDLLHYDELRESMTTVKWVPGKGVRLKAFVHERPDGEWWETASGDLEIRLETRKWKAKENWCPDYFGGYGKVVPVEVIIRPIKPKRRRK